MALIRLLVTMVFVAVGTMTITTAHGQQSQDTPAETAPAEVATAPLVPEAVDIGNEVLTILLVPKTAEDLSALAAVWQGHLKETLEALAALNVQLQTANDTRADQLREQIADLVNTQGAVRGNYVAVLDAWEAKGAAAEDVQTHRDYVEALAIASLQTTDARTLASLAMDWATSWDGGLGVILQIFGLVIAVWVMMFVARMAQRLSKRGLSNVPNLSRLLQSFIVGAVYWATFVLGVLIVLAAFGVNVTPLFAIFGGLSFILGFALQDTLGNLASGLMIMILKPFDTGDYIQVGGASGFVDEMSIVSTKIKTFDNQIIVVPNSKIWGDVITNVSASAERRVDLVFGIGYDDNATHAIKVLQGLIEAHPACLKVPAAEVFVGELGESSVNIFCRPWCKSDDYWTVYWDLTGQAKQHFDAEGISIPFPQRDVHLYQVAATQEPA